MFLLFVKHYQRSHFETRCDHRFVIPKSPSSISTLLMQMILITLTILYQLKLGLGPHCSCYSERENRQEYSHHQLRLGECKIPFGPSHTEYISHNFSFLNKSIPTLKGIQPLLTKTKMANNTQQTYTHTYT